jgi:hypothetical protein
VNWFGKLIKKKEPEAVSHVLKELKAEGPSMHILTLDPLTKEVFGVTTAQGDTVSIPAITTDGRISFLPAGSPEEFYKLQQAMNKRMAEQHPTLTDAANVAVVGVNIITKPEKAPHTYFIFEVLGSPEPMPELEQIYQLLTGLRTVGDKQWKEVEEFFSSEPRKSWINDVIEIWKQKLNWADYVERAMALHQQSLSMEEGNERE